MKEAEMKRWTVLALALAMILWGAGVAQADGYGDDRDRRSENNEERLALGIGIGLVETGENIADDVENYITATLRIRIGDESSHGGGGEGGFRGYIEPEIGYWEASEAGFDATDALLGVNLIGVVPYNAVDFFIGAGIGVHFNDSDINVGGVSTSSDDTALGLNAQFGLDVHLTENVSIFGVGRFDIVDDVAGDFQGKVYVGVRFGL